MVGSAVMYHAQIKLCRDVQNEVITMLQSQHFVRTIGKGTANSRGFLLTIVHCYSILESEELSL